MERKLSERQLRAKKELDKMLFRPSIRLDMFGNKNYDFDMLKLKQKTMEDDFLKFKKGFNYLKINLSFVFLCDVLMGVCLLFAWAFSIIPYATDIFLLLAVTCFMISTVAKTHLLKY